VLGTSNCLPTEINKQQLPATMTTAGKNKKNIYKKDKKKGNTTVIELFY